MVIYFKRWIEIEILNLLSRVVIPSLELMTVLKKSVISMHLLKGPILHPQNSKIPFDFKGNRIAAKNIFVWLTNGHLRCIRQDSLASFLCVFAPVYEHLQEKGFLFSQLV